MSAKYGSRLKTVRKKLGFSQNELAQKVGISVNSLQRYENDDREPTISVLDRIAEACDLSLGELLWIDLENLPQTGGNAEANRNSPFKLIREQQQQKDLQSKLDSTFAQLNIVGKEKVVAFSEDIAKIPEYQKKDEPGQE